jgi:hypothetical protein
MEKTAGLAEEETFANISSLFCVLLTVIVLDYQ